MAKRPDVEPLTYSYRELAAALGVGLATVERLHAAGRLPAPVRISTNRVVWPRAAIRAWLEAGCPDRLTFEQARADERGGGE